MSDDKLLDLELVILNKRIELLEHMGAEPLLQYGLKENLLDLIKDKWIFNGLLTAIYSVEEMSTEDREAKVKAALPKRRGRPPKKQVADCE